MSGLSDRFVNNFLDSDGILEPIISRLKYDHTLMLAIRKNYVNIYYRGGNILRITELSKVYKAEFDDNYKLQNCKCEAPKSPNYITTVKDAEDWVDSFAQRKIIMDHFFAEKGKSEREFQQLIARENNNSSISSQCEYFIADIEYTVPKLGRFDMLAIRWLAKDRKTGKCTPALIEMKYGDDALEDESGLVEHLKQMTDFMENDTSARSEMLQTIETRFNQLDKLELLNYNKGTSKAKIHFSEEYNPELIFILANHNPRSIRLSNILNELEAYDISPKLDLRFYVASFAGYGLHAECMRDLIDFKKLCQLQLHLKD
jgi:hypothetical protein